MKHMRVLWLSMQPSPEYARVSSSGPYSWIDNLADILTKAQPIELARIAPSEDQIAPQMIGGVKHYNIPIQGRGGRLGRVWGRWMGDIDIPGWRASVDSAISDFKPDVIHIHGTENPFGLLVASSKVPVVVSLQGLIEGLRRHVFVGFSCLERLSLCTSWEFIRGSGQIHVYRRYQKMAKREMEIFRKGNNFIGRTAWDRAVLATINRDATYHHCDEVLRPAFYGKAWDEKDADINTLYTTSSTMLFKGCEVLLEAFSLLRRGGNETLKLRVCGLHPTGELFGLLERRMRRLGLSNNGCVLWLGRLGPEDIVREILRAGIFVYPSHIDNSPNALCEAQLLGAPCVAGAVGGIPTILQNEVTGLLYDDKDPYALASQLTRFLKNREEAAKIGAAARRIALRRHDPKVVAERVFKIYCELTNQDTPLQIFDEFR